MPEPLTFRGTDAKEFPILYGPKRTSSNVRRSALPLPAPCGCPRGCTARGRGRRRLSAPEEAPAPTPSRSCAGPACGGSRASTAARARPCAADTQLRQQAILAELKEIGL